MGILEVQDYFDYISDWLSGGATSLVFHTEAPMEAKGVIVAIAQYSLFSDSDCFSLVTQSLGPFCVKSNRCLAEGYYIH